MPYHTSVLFEDVVSNLVGAKNGMYVDGTLGGGGHTEGILKNLNEDGRVIALDRDGEAIELCQKKFQSEDRLTIVRERFSNMKTVVGEKKVDGVLLDLGVSSRQLDSRERGFSFEPNSPLDMRMDQKDSQSALEYIRKIREEELANVLWRNADIKQSRKIARAVKNLIQEYDNSNLIHKALDQLYPKGLPDKNRMLARIFQAIRMEVNQEVQEIEAGLKSAVDLLKPKGRLCVITFHSIEDRQVKKFVQNLEKSCICPPEFPLCTCGGNHQKLKKVHKKPLTASNVEVEENPRARSAKLRVAERVAL